MQESNWHWMISGITSSRNGTPYLSLELKYQMFPRVVSWSIKLFLDFKYEYWNIMVNLNRTPIQMKCVKIGIYMGLLGASIKQILSFIWETLTILKLLCEVYMPNHKLHFQYHKLSSNPSHIQHLFSQTAMDCLDRMLRRSTDNSKSTNIQKIIICNSGNEMMVF